MEGRQKGDKIERNRGQDLMKTSIRGNQRHERRYAKGREGETFTQAHTLTQSHRQLHISARAAEMCRLSIHPLVAPCQLNQHKAA